MKPPRSPWVLIAPPNDVVPSDHTTTLPPAPDVPSAVIVAPASIVVFCALAMVCGRNFSAASDPPARSPPISTVPPDVPLASIAAPEVRVTSVPVTTTVPPAPPLPFASIVPPTTTLSPLTTTSPPVNARRPARRASARAHVRLNAPRHDFLRHVDRTALGREENSAALAGDACCRDGPPGVAGKRINVAAIGAQFYFRGADRTAVADLAILRRTPHRDLAIAERAVAQHHLAAGRHRGGAVARGQRAVVTNLARDQDDIALRRADFAEIDNRGVAVAAESQRSSGAELRILDVQCRGDKTAAGLDLPARPDDYSRRIDEVDRAGRRQDAVDRRRHIAGHAVECRAAAVIELNLIALPDRKARPVDDAGAARLADREAGRRRRTDRNVSARHRSAGRQRLRKRLVARDPNSTKAQSR